MTKPTPQFTQLSCSFLGILFLAHIFCCSDCYEIEINSNIILLGDWDYRPWGVNNQSRCTEMVDKVMEFEVTKVQFVPTQFWVDYDGDQIPDAFCHKYSNSNCTLFNQQAIDEFRDDMEICFKHAINKGLSISLSPHLDDGLELGGWRNTIPFDPLQPYGGFSYYEIMLKPLADALRNTLQYNTKIWFGLQGEMGATILYNPYSYIEAIEMLRDVIVSESQIQPNLEFGLGFNFNKLCGCVLMDVVDTVEYIDRFPDAIAPVLNTFDVEGLQALFEVIDFVGISSYAQLKPYFATPELQNAIYYFDREISEFGVDLRQLMKNGLDLHFMEYGVGGGSSQEGGGRAATQDEVAQFPFFGIFGAYNKGVDPWEMQSYSLNPARAYMHYFYTQTMQLAGSAIQPNYDISREFFHSHYIYNVRAIFIWNLASWDVQAIYPDSTTDQGSYRDEYVVELIKNHNSLIKANQQ